MDNKPYKRGRTTPKLYAVAFDMTSDKVEVVGIPTKKLFPDRNSVMLFAAGERLRAGVQFREKPELLKQAQDTIDKWEEETILRLFPVPSKE